MEFFGLFGGLLDQRASPPKRKKRGAKALKVRAEYQAAKRAAITSRQLPSFGVKELTAFVRAIERRFSQIRRERVAQKQRWRADRECPKAVPELARRQLFALHSRAFATAEISGRVTQWSALDTAGVRAP